MSGVTVNRTCDLGLARVWPRTGNLPVFPTVLGKLTDNLNFQTAVSESGV